MATTYTTSSTANSNLDGSMIMDGDTVTSYTSTNLAVTDSNPTMQGGTGLHFKVQFTKNGVTSKYHVNAHKTDNGKDFKGDSGSDAAEADTDDWTATDNGPES
jgi:hypothetical protein